MRRLALLPAIVLAGCAHAPDVPRYQPIKHIAKPAAPEQTLRDRWLSAFFRERAAAK